MAAGDAAGAAGRQFAAEVEATLGAEMRAGRECLRAFKKRPMLSHLAMASTTPGWVGFQRLSTGRTTFARVMRHRAVRLAMTIAQR